MSVRVGFVGLGDQGEPMAERVLKAGFPLTIFARRVEIRERFAGMGAGVAPTLRELGAASDIVGICVVDDEQVRDVTLRDDGILAGMASGGIIAVHSSVHPDTCRELGAIGAARGVAVVDAPVTGTGRRGAQEGTLTLLVGGDAAVVERCVPVFECFSTTIGHLGALGAGETAKLLNNFFFAAHVGTAFDEATLARRLGLDLHQASTVLPLGSGASRVLDMSARQDLRYVLPPHEKGRDSAWRILAKDVRLFRDVMAKAGVESPEADALVTRSMGLLEETDGALGQPEG